MAGWYTSRPDQTMKEHRCAFDRSPRRLAAAARCSRAPRRRADLPRAEGPGQGRAEAQGAVQDPHGLQEARLRVPHDPGRGEQGQGGRHDQVVPRAPTSEAVRIIGAKEALHQDRRRPARSPRKVVLEGSGKKQNGVLRQRRRRGHDRRLHGPATTRPTASSSSTSSATRCTHLRRREDGRLRPLRLQLQGRHDARLGGLLQQRRGLLHRADAAAGQADPLDRARTSSRWGNPLGFSGTNMRYVTITKSRFYNNAIGIVPNALDSEKFPPAEDNVITDNDDLLEQLQLPRGRAVQDPDGERRGAAGAGRHRRPAARRPRTTASRTTAIYGNYLVGVARDPGHPARQDHRRRATSIGNQITRQRVRRWAATDLNGRDLAYDGNGTGNCFAGNTGVAGHRCPPTRSTFPPCPFAGANAFSQDAQSRAARLRGRGERAQGLDQAPARGQAGLRRRWSSTRSDGAPDPVRSPSPPRRARARRRRRPPRPSRKTVKVADNYYLPAKLTVKPGHRRSTWKWPAEARSTSTTSSSSRRPKGVQEVPVRPGLQPATVQAHAEEARALQDRLHAPRGDDA